MRTQVGNVITESCGDELTVYTDQYGVEEIDAVTIEGRAANIVFDPGTTEGRAQIEALRARLAEALALADAEVERLYGQLKVGDYCVEIRLPKSEPRCKHTVTDGRLHWQCSRPAHSDLHHVRVDDNFCVVGVRHATDRVLPNA